MASRNWWSGSSSTRLVKAGCIYRIGVNGGIGVNGARFDVGTVAADVGLGKPGYKWRPHSEPHFPTIVILGRWCRLPGAFACPKVQPPRSMRFSVCPIRSSLDRMRATLFCAAVRAHRRCIKLPAKYGVIHYPGVRSS